MMRSPQHDASPVEKSLRDANEKINQIFILK